MASKAQAIAAYVVLDYIGRDLVAASEAFRHFQSAEVRKQLSQSSPAYLNRLCLNHMFIALARFQEFYRKFGRDIPQAARSSAKSLNAGLDRRGLREFRNDFLVHVWSTKHSRPLTSSEISAAAHRVAGGEFADFVAWVHDYRAPNTRCTAAQVIEQVRDSIFEVYRLTDRDIAPALFGSDA